MQQVGGTTDSKNTGNRLALKLSSPTPASQPNASYRETFKYAWVFQTLPLRHWPWLRVIVF